MFPHLCSPVVHEFFLLPDLAQRLEGCPEVVLLMGTEVLDEIRAGWLPFGCCVVAGSSVV